MQTLPTNSLGSAVAEAEADLLFGRESEIGTLRSCVAVAAVHPVVAYLHGPAGTGKSSLLRAVLRGLQADGVNSLLLDADAVGGTPEAIGRALGDQLPAPLPQGPGLGAAAAAALQERVGARGFVFAIDHYEEFVACDAWLRREILYRLGAGVCVLLVGRRSPDEAWPGDRPWRSVIRSVALRDFSPQEAAEFLRHCGVQGGEARSEALRLAGTSPSLLAVVADAVTRLGARRSSVPTAEIGGEADELGRCSALVEQILHPGSRRRAWRAGLGSNGVDKLLAAASLLSSFDRESVAAMVGSTVVEADWTQLTRLSLVYPHNGRYAIHETVRAAMNEIVVRQRPWAQQRWRRLVLSHLLGRVHDGSVSQEEAARVALSAPRFAGRFGGSVGTHVLTGGTAEDLVALEQPAEELLWLQRTHPEAFRVLRDAEDAPLGYVLALPAVEEWLAAAVGRPAALRARSAAAVAGPGPTLVLCRLVMRRDAADAGARLLAELLPEFRQQARVVSLLPESAAGDVLGLLGFRTPDAPSGGTPPLPVLDFAACGGWSVWLRQLIQPGEGQAVPPARRHEAAQEALAAFHDDHRLAQTAAARHFAAQCGQAVTGPQVRTWLLDALNSMDLGEPTVPSRELLRRYYIQRSGSHEAIAEELGVARATYFRWHRMALHRFADNLLS